MSKYPILAFFGTGSESIKTLFLSEFSYFSGYNTVDNQYLTLLVEAGLLGACLFFISIFSVVRKPWHQNDKIGITCRLFFYYVLYSSNNIWTNFIFPVYDNSVCISIMGKK